ncbi:uncharacterized protein B0H18DRAFT_1212614 [Fomitopsis serialis]|uniref:uncharacterized protein n=1 Tax=Fomitopsis serialis TaxID=139415 RepID=UPI002008708D|nr:uncharacterized protein B0H18DRAFT_1212614 [Neoantrodia serialis]KAH9922380.1 hypothetical protein B0H18DRAFT_1212614 [Neoantrodia serialis]
MLTDNRLLLIEDFERVVRGQVSLVDAALEVNITLPENVMFIGVYLAYEFGRVSVVTSSTCSETRPSRPRETASPSGSSAPPPPRLRLGDTDKLYVLPECIPIYREVLRYSTVITPNWSQVDWVTHLASIRKALHVMHEDYHVPDIIISSFPLKAWVCVALAPAAQPTDTDSPDTDFLACISASASAEQGAARPVYFSDVTVGDLFSTLVLGHFQLAPSVPSANAEFGAEKETLLAPAVAHALSKTHALLTLTHEHTAGLPEADTLPTDEEPDAGEPERKSLQTG